jgi:hypothetical protein
MSTRRLRWLDELPTLARSLREAGGVLTGEPAAHVHMAAATGSVPGAAPAYPALPPPPTQAILPGEVASIRGATADLGAVAETVRHRLDLFSTIIRLSDGTEVPVLSREAVLADLLSKGGLAVGVAGVLLRVAGDPPVDTDEVREILKAARMGHLFQPMLELMDGAR